MSEALNLYRLQQLDIKVDQSQDRIVAINQHLDNDQQIQSAQQAVEKAEAISREIRINLNQLEDKVEAQLIKRKLGQASLFSGKIKNPKELQDIQMESDALKRYIEQLEEEQLGLMIENEAADETLDQARKNLQQTIGTTSEKNAYLIGEKTQLKESLERWEREREAVLQSIPATSLKLYQQLRKSKRGVAVTTVSDGGCSICGQALTPADRQKVRRSAQLVFCPSCGRILFAD